MPASMAPLRLDPSFGRDPYAIACVVHTSAQTFAAKTHQKAPIAGIPALHPQLSAPRGLDVLPSKPISLSKNLVTDLT